MAQLVQAEVLPRDPEEVFSVLASQEDEDGSRAMLDIVYRQIAFLTRAYREVMILFYLEGLPVAEIARRQGAGEGAIRQRLSLARKRIQCEVEEMAESNQKPVVLDQIEYSIAGSGNPCQGILIVVRKCLQITAASLWQFLLYFRAFA